MKKKLKAIFIIKLSLFALIYTFPVQSQDSDKDEVFRPHMLDHKNEGCPTNSTCSSILGVKMKIWIAQLEANKAMAPKNLDKLNTFLRQDGIPLEFWLAPAISNEQVISWDSACQEHQKEGKLVDVGMLFTKALNEQSILASAEMIKPSIMIDHVFVSQDKSIETFPRLRGQMPIAFDDQHFIYLQDLEGVYWSLNVSQKGALMIGPTVSAPSHTEIDCPPDLIAFAKQHPPRQQIYESYFCKRMSNLHGTKYVVVMFPFACD